MKKALIAAVALSLVLAIAAFAADSGQPNVPAQNFDQRKTDILKMLDERLASLQDAKNCIQAATNNDDIKTCRNKHRAEMMEKRGEMPHQHGMGGPGSPMGK